MIEVAFILEKPDQEKSAFLVKIVEIEKQDLKIKFLPAQRILYKETLSRLATAKDKDALLALMHEEMQFQGLSGLRHSSDTLPFNKIHVRPQHVEKILKELAATTKLFFNGKQVLVDFFNPVEFFCTASLTKDGLCAISGKCLWNGQEVDLFSSELFFLGPPHGLLKDRVIRFMTGKQHQSIDGKWLRPFQKQEVLIIEEARIKETLEKYGDQDFRFVCDFQLVATEKEPEVFPILILKDRSGGFANLYMDYGQGKVVDYHGMTSFPRQKELEKSWEKDLLETDFIKKQVGSTHYYCPLNKVAKSLTFLLECGWTIKDAQGKKIYRLNDASMNLENRASELIVTGQVSYEKYQVDLKDVVGAFNRRETFISLSGDAVGLLPESFKEEYSPLLEGEVVSEGIKIKKNRFGTLKDLFNQPHLSMDATALYLQKCLENFAGMQDCPVDSSFVGDLRPYQQQGVNWLSFLHNNGFHGLLADDMGLGKTVQILAFLSTLKTELPHLIVLPTTLLFNWQKEIERFLPHMKIYRHHGTNRAKKSSDFQECSIILTSYGTLRQDRHLLREISFHCLIIDEAQMIKNPESQIAQAVFDLKGSMRLSVTGTPIENRLEDLWTQFFFLMPDLLENREQFRSEIVASGQDFRYLQRIRKKIAPFMLRRTKLEVARDLPEKIEQTVWVEMTPQQRQLYETFLAGVRQGLLQKVTIEGTKAHRFEIFESILRLRQICCHPQLVSQLNEETPESSSKFEQLFQDLETLMAEEKKVLIYSQFTSMLGLIAKECGARGWPFAYLDGSTQNREKVVEQFQQDPKVRFFLISLKAGGIGLNLTAADYVLLYDPWWNEAVENQAIDRAHRIGRTQTVIAKRYVMAESIEEKMMKLKAAKRFVAQEILSEGAQSLSLTEEDLQFLLS